MYDMLNRWWLSVKRMTLVKNRIGNDFKNICNVTTQPLAELVRVLARDSERAIKPSSKPSGVVGTVTLQQQIPLRM